MTDICCVCTGLVATIDGLLVEHRHREQFSPCPAGQVPLAPGGSLPTTTTAADSSGQSRSNT